MRQTLSRNTGFETRRDCQPIIGVKRQIFRMDDEHAHLADAAFQKVRDSILQRDNFSCRFCGFKAHKYQEVHHHDDNHKNNDPDNLWTVCNLCHQVHHAFFAGTANAGFFAAIPELTQTEINHICRAIFVTNVINQHPYVINKLRGLYALFRAAADELKEAFGADISSPIMIAQGLAVIDQAAFDKRASILENIRLIPTQEAFHAEQLEYYAQNKNQIFTPERWSALVPQLMR
jgi:intracellular multiplication protein IcmJ